MPQRDVAIPTADGTCQASLHVPDGSGPWPGVILFPDAGGARDTLRAMADRLAGLGYVTLVPDLYYRAGGYEPFDLATVLTDDAQRGRMMQLVRSLTNDVVERDSHAYISYLLKREEVAGSAVGTTGYCMGGRISLLVAGLHPERVAATASFHGGFLAPDGDPSSPHLLADRIRARLYIAGAIEDQTFPPDQYERLEQALSAAGVAFEMQTYQAHHGFAVADNPSYDPAAEQRHWDALERLYATLPR